MLHWFKTNFDQFEGSSWYYEGKGDEKIYESSIEHIGQQLKLQKKQKLKNTIGELGFKEERDYNGKMVLKNHIPIKKTMDFRQTENLVSRLKQHKKAQPNHSISSKESSISTGSGFKKWPRR